MNGVYLLCCLLSLTTAAVIPDESQAKIVNYENTNNGAGEYSFSYETSNGIFRKESGYVVKVGKEDEHMVVTGSYSYTDVDGKHVLVTYSADENGFHINPPRTIAQATYSLPANVVATLLGK